MPSVNYDRFYLGDAQDEIISSTPQVLESNNVTGLNTGYGITLGPKSNKVFTTNGAMRGIYIKKQLRTSDNADNFAFGDNGEIYRFDGADLTPIYTVGTGFQVTGLFETDANFYYLHRDTATGNIMDLGEATNRDFTVTTDSYNTQIISHTECPPILKTGGTIYVGGGGKIVTITNETTPTIANKSIIDGTCVGISKNGNQFYLYTTNQECFIWDGASNSNSGSNVLNFPPRKTRQVASKTFATSRDGDFLQGNGWQFQKITKRFQSKRLEDNSSFQEKMNFSGTEEVRGQYITNVGEDIYIGCNDGTPGIYKYGNIIEGTPNGLHKIVTKNHEGVAIDEIYAMEYDHTQDKVFYSYKAGTTYGIDSISTIGGETAQDGYFVTQVWRGPPNKMNKSTEKRITYSNASGNNYVKLYVRVNDGSWLLLRDSRNIVDNDTIFRDKVKSAEQSKQYVNIQMKVELYNSLQSEDAPTVQGLEEIYSIIRDR